MIKDCQAPKIALFQFPLLALSITVILSIHAPFGLTVYAWHLESLVPLMHCKPIIRRPDYSITFSIVENLDSKYVNGAYRVSGPSSQTMYSTLNQHQRR